jgi:hypothetical protein
LQKALVVDLGRQKQLSFFPLAVKQVQVSESGGQILENLRGDLGVFGIHDLNIIKNKSTELRRGI